MLRCGDGSVYTGATNDLARRLARHQQGRASAYTRSRLPVELLFVQPVRGRGVALRKESALKKLSHAEKLALARVHRAQS